MVNAVGSMHVAILVSIIMQCPIAMNHPSKKSTLVAKSCKENSRHSNYSFCYCFKSIFNRGIIRVIKAKQLVTRKVKNIFLLIMIHL